MLPERKLVLLIFVSNHVNTLSKDKNNNPVFMYRMSKTAMWVIHFGGDFLFKGMCPNSDLMIGFLGVFVISSKRGYIFISLFYCTLFISQELILDILLLPSDG